MGEDELYWLGHRGRLRDKARSVGLEELRPYEVVELILYQSDLRADMAGLARELINRFGTVRALLTASLDELMSVPGMKRKAAEWILRTGELTRRFRAADCAQIPGVWRTWDLIHAVAPMRPKVVPPQSWMLYADHEDRLLMCSPLCDSLAWADPDIAHGVIQEALALQARRAFLVCFTGVELPELTEYESTFLEQLAYTLRAVQVELLDCLMVSESGYKSMNRSGAMDRVRLSSVETWLHERYLEEEP